MILDFEYGQGFMAAELPDSIDIFIPGETIEDPPYLKQPLEETRKAISNPVGFPPIPQCIKPDAKVTIIFPDRVKGGSHETSHRKVAIPIIIEECLKAGVEKKNIKLICSNGLHRKNTREEIKNLIGSTVFDDFWWTNQIVNHDSEDWENLIDLGFDTMGNRVIMNKDVFESDLAILIGHVLGNPYGGYSGGYKHCATGITHWKSIASHHVPHVMHRDDFTPVNNRSLMRQKFDSIGRYMEQCMGKRFFTVDAVLDTYARQLAVMAGDTGKVQQHLWNVADKRTYVKWAKKKYDVVMFGMPQSFHYGNGMGTNPILILQAIAANIIRHRRILKDNFVVICSSLCNGYFHDEEFPAYRDVYTLFQHNYNNQLTDLEKYGEYFATRKEYIEKYRYNYGYHPYHAFSMISCGHIAEMACCAIYVVGAIEPGIARSMGMKTRATFKEALEDAKKKYIGPDPNILALPKAFTSAAVHLESA